MILRITFLAIILPLLLTSCEERSDAPTALFGNNIDSVVYYSYGTGGVAIPNVAEKIFYYPGTNKFDLKRYSWDPITKIQQLDYIRNYSIEQRKIIQYSVSYPSDTLFYITTFDNNNILVSFQQKHNRSIEGDSTVYHYNSKGQLHQVIKYYTSFSGESPRRQIYTDTYTWMNGNIQSIESTVSENSYPIQTRYYTTYTYTNIKNPLYYHYQFAYGGLPYLKLGIACSNLVESEHSKSSTTKYSYSLSPSTNSYLVTINKGNVISFRNVFYTKGN